MNKNLAIYQKYYVDKQSEKLDLFRIIKEKYKVESAIYPGSFVHVTPSLVFPRTVYIDNDRRVQSFFDDPGVLKWIESKKEYIEQPIVHGYQQNYATKLPDDIGQFDLLISQYAGFVSQECRKYLKTGGFLLVNNSHADAGMAFLDSDYKLIAALNHSKNKWRISETGLQEYFKPKKGTHPTKSELLKNMRGVGYTKTAANYLFKKL